MHNWPGTQTLYPLRHVPFSVFRVHYYMCICKEINHDWPITSFQNHHDDTLKLAKRPKLVAWANHWHAHKRVQLKSAVLTSKTPAVIGSDKRKTHRSGWKEKAAVKENQLIQREPPCLEGGKFIWLLSNCILFFRSSCYGDGDSLMIPFWSLTLSQKKETLTQCCFNIVPASATLAKY